LTRVFIIAGHLYACLSAPALEVGGRSLGDLFVGSRLLFLRRRSRGPGLIQQFELTAGVGLLPESRRSKNTIVSWMRSRRKRASGSEYSAMMRTSRPSGLLIKAGFWYDKGARWRWGGLPVFSVMLS